MERKNKKWFRNYLAKIVQYFVIISMIILTIIASLYFAFEMYNFILKVLSLKLEKKEFIDDVFYLLIILEVIFIGLKYFEENLHIPKRYFLYIAITTLVKEIFIYPDKALIYSGSIIVLVIASSLIKYINYLTKDKKKEPITEKD